MGTRADFYVGKGKKAEWLGSIAWDGYPEGVDKAVLNAKTEEGFRNALEKFFSVRDDVTKPSEGWPWPWDDSHLTDYAYTFDEGFVYYTVGGSKNDRWWRHADGPQPNSDFIINKLPHAIFPNMKKLKNVRWDKGSGLIVVGIR